MESKPFVPEAPSVSAILDQLWVKFLPQMQERVATLQDAGDALALSELPPAVRAEAHSAAHKLAGILGTFGLENGTTLAREAESLLAPGKNLDSPAQHRLDQISTEIRSMIGSRP
ncbi:MAG TPA: Hpt domain-containing protein [Terracidiphilus sp.]|jgi:HPt (histidine-containing phosphotransfer) domain-containing protein|nr:Hpt domain-containing protein [Terracidiphilus sp.]